MSSILILGAMSDVAQAMAHEYAKNGYEVILAARKKERLESLEKDLQIRYNVKVSSVEFDALNFKSHFDFYKDLPHEPTAVACVFGYLGDTAKGLLDWNEAEEILHINYTGAVSILNVIASNMMERKHGTIIGISSVAGERGRQSNFLYGSAKAGFTAYLSGLRNKCFHSGVHVLTVKPGFIKTSMTQGMPLNPKLTATPQKIAKDIFKAANKKKNVLFSLWMWKYIMKIITSIPEGVFKKMKM
jgi:decaprenylphospho-beta-D-erythro-pentofuranosid-2-ulose 2-reductase